MRVLVIGSRGNMGRRYMAILKYLGVETIGMDIDQPQNKYVGFDRAIIATPSENHFYWCKFFTNERKPFLCEKPVVTNLLQMRMLVDNNLVSWGRMVCNWAFVNPDILKPESNQVQYSNYNTGKDGLAWDCIQLIYLADGMPELSTTSPYLDCQINGTRVHEGHIAMSYVGRAMSL